MFRLTKDTWLKQDILDYLDNQPEPIYFQELLKEFPQISLSTLQKKCRELDELIQDCYPDQTVQLRIDKRNGIQLVREQDNLQKVTSALIKNELPYQLVKRFIYVDSFEASDICEELNISQSQLRRKVRDFNNLTNKYGIHVTVSREVKIFGSEVMRRALAIYTLSTTYRQFSAIEWIDNPDFYFNQSVKILNYLDLSLIHSHIESISLVTLIIEQAIRGKRVIHLSDEIIEIFSLIQLPKKPYFLAHWDEYDWIYFIATIYGANFASFDLDIADSLKGYVVHSEIAQTWVTLFEKHFGKLTDSDYELIHNHLFRGYLTYEVLHVDFTFFGSHTLNTVKTIETLHPRYYKVFESFWQAYITTYPLYNTEYVKLQNLLTCHLIKSLDHFLPTITLYLDTNLMFSFEKLLQSRIISYFSTDYEIRFMTNREDADFIISIFACTICKNTSQDKFILIEPSLSTNDLQEMKKRFDAHSS